MMRVVTADGRVRLAVLCALWAPRSSPFPSTPTIRNEGIPMWCPQPRLSWPRTSYCPSPTPRQSRFCPSKPTGRRGAAGRQCAQCV